MLYPEIRIELREEAGYFALANTPRWYAHALPQTQDQNREPSRENGGAHALPPSVMRVFERMLD